MYKVINCEKPGCGSPMTLRVHLGCAEDGLHEAQVPCTKT